MKFGCAIAALCDKRRPRSIISVPSGKGKSRIIAAAVALAARYDGVRNFAIVYSSELLKSVDTRSYQMLGSLLMINIKQVVFDQSVGLRNQIDQDRFLLIDEADFVLIDGLQTVQN